jgi:hypothetical protein
VPMANLGGVPDCSVGSSNSICMLPWLFKK